MLTRCFTVLSPVFSKNLIAKKLTLSQHAHTHTHALMHAHTHTHTHTHTQTYHKELIKMPLFLLWAYNWLTPWILGLIIGVLIHVLKKNCLCGEISRSHAQPYIKFVTDSKAYLTECWFVVQARAPVAMTARTNLEVKGAVYSG